MTTESGPYAFPTDRPPDMKTSVSFPKTTCSLWDKNATGNPVFLHIGYYRKPKVCIPEKILRLIQHQCENYSQTHHMLIGSLVVEDDGEGVQFQVDRLDTRSKIPSDGSGLAPGDLLIPLEVSNNTADKERSGTVEDYHCALRRLQSRCCSKSSVDLCEFVLLRGWGSFYSNAHSSVAHLDFDMVTMQTVLKATPIAPVPILLTALSKNLAGPMSLSHMQGTTKTGYLSMDHTRKLLLVLESDPKASSLPLVGIWVSGAEFVQHPFVWASCLRFMHNTHLQARVCTPPGEFLLVVYTPLHSRPEFYQCCPTSGTSNFEFELKSGHEVANMPKALSTPCHDFTEVELFAVEGGGKMELFDAAKAEHGLELYKAIADNGNVSLPEDIEPRCAPTPHMERVPTIRPMVPDVSILWTEPPESPSQHQVHVSSVAQSSQQQNFQISDAVLKRSYMSQGFQKSSNASSVSVSVQSSAISSAHSSNDPTLSSSAQPALQQFACGSTGQSHPSYAGIQARNALSRHKSPFPGAFHQGVHVNQQAEVHPGTHVSLSKQGGQSAWSPAPQSGLAPASVPSTTALLASHAHSGYVSPGTFTYSTSSSSLGYHSQISANSSQSPVQNNASFQPSSASPSYLSQHPPSQGHQQPQQGSRVTGPARIVFTPATPASHDPSAVGVSRGSPVTSQFQGSGPSGAQSSLNRQGQISETSSIPLRGPLTFLNTVVEESSSSQSPSSSSSSSSRTRPACQLRQELNGNILASSSQSLGLNSTQGNGSRHSNSSSSSSRICQSSDDDDSGLSITPDRVNSSPPQQPVPGAAESQPTSCGGGSGMAVSLPSALIAPPNEMAASTAAVGNLSAVGPESSLDSVRWNEVPPAVRALLEQQNQQLKVLQQQIQMLLHNQSQQSALSVNQSHQAPSHQSQQDRQSGSMNQSTAMQSESDPGHQQQQHLPNSLSAGHNKTEMCSIGVNTTILEDSSIGQDLTDSRSVQTSPVKMHHGHHNMFLSPVQQDDSSNDKPNDDVSSSGNTPAELQHHSRPPISSTRYESPGLTPLGRPGGPVGSNFTKVVSHEGEEVEEELANQKDLVSAMAALPIQDQTMNTAASQLVVDMPEYASTVNDGFALDQSRSPPSVSDFYGQGQDDSYSTVAEDALDPKQYYSQLMNNIQMFLTNDKSRETDLSEDRNQSETTLETASPLKCAGTNSANSSIIPRINYVSMMLGNSVCSSPAGKGPSWWGSDPGQSMEINAMAMKYLSDEQLTQMAMLRRLQEAGAQGKKSSPSKATAQMLQMVLEGQQHLAGDASSAGEFSLRPGGSPNDMSMATHKYLEKHGLLGNNDSIMMAGAGSGELSDFEHSIKLRTDFSMAPSGAGSGKTTPCSKRDRNDRLSQPVSPVKSPLRQEIVSPTLGHKKDSDMPFHNGYPRPTPNSDLGASPVLKPFSSKQNIPFGAAPNTLNKPANARSPIHGPARRRPANSKQNDSLNAEDAEEENILDIARLKQMPKLL